MRTIEWSTTRMYFSVEENDYLARYEQQFYTILRRVSSKIKLTWSIVGRFMAHVCTMGRYGPLEVLWNSCPLLLVIPPRPMELKAINGQNCHYYRLKFFQQVELNIMIRYMFLEIECSLLLLMIRKTIHIAYFHWTIYQSIQIKRYFAIISIYMWLQSLRFWK